MRHAPRGSRDGGGDRTAQGLAEVARLRLGLDRLEAALSAMAGGGGAAGPAARARPERYYRLLVDVYEWGRHGVPGEAFAGLGRARGYDARGLGGFFVGARAPLRRQDEQVRLTVEGHRLVGEFLRGDHPVA